MKMKILNILFVSVAVMAAASCSKENLQGTAGSAVQQPEEKPYLPGEVVVKFDPSLSGLLDEAGISKSPATRSGISTVDQILDIVDGYQLERVFPEVKATEAKSREAGLHLWYVVRFSEDEDVQDVVSRLSALGEVQAATPVRTIKKLYDGKVIPFRPGNAGAVTRADVTPLPYGDSYLKWQWSFINNGADNYTLNQADIDALGDSYPFDGRQAADKFRIGDDIRVAEAWEKCKGDPSIIVAVLDEGICLEHEDLKYNLWTNDDETYGSLEDNDGNGYAGDYYGYDFLNNRGIITWDAIGDTGHGSHVSGVIAARNDNGTGISSIAGGTASEPGVRLMSCQVFSGNLASNTVSLARAIKYAADNGAVVLQCSFGYTSGTANPYEYGTGFRDEEEWEAGSPLEKSALDYFIHNAGSDNGPIKGGIPVFAAGNEYAPSAGFPGAYEKCVSVAAVAGDYTPSTFTNYGPGTSIAAPGGDQDYYFDFKGADGEVDAARGAAGCILSTVPAHVSESGYGYMEGTSMACPHVSGVVALGLSYAAKLHKHFTADEFRELLYASCTAVPAEAVSGYKFYYKWQVDASHLIHGRRLELGPFNGQLGAGIVNAAELLNRIEGNDAGVQMKFPNIYVAEGASVTADASAFLEGTSFSVTVENTAIAEVSTDGSNIRFTGLESGSTEATITPAGGAAQTFVITVRSSEDSSGWL